MGAGAESFVAWMRDAPPNRKYYFMLDGKPYRGAFNRKYVGKQVLYYTGVKATRYSKQLEHIPKGFEVSDEPVINTMDRWLFNKPVSILRERHEELMTEEPLYGGIVGHNGISNEAVRRPILGYKMSKQNPFNGKKNELETTFTKRLEDLQEEQKTAREQQVAEQSKFSNPMEQPKKERRRVAKMKKDAFDEQIENELDIMLATPSIVPPAEYVRSTRKKLLAGEAATEYLEKRANFVKQYIDTLTNRSMSYIIQSVAVHFRVTAPRAQSFLARNPGLINRNK